jgi:hypothetical protein
MTPLALAAVAVGLITPGAWTGSTADLRGSETRARVRFEVLGGAGLVQPAVRVDLHGCRRPRVVHLRPPFGLVSVNARGRFTTRIRYLPPRRTSRVRLRLSGRFVSGTVARGRLRGRIRYFDGQICRIPRMSWTTRPVGLPPAVDPGPGSGSSADDDEDLDDAIIDDEDLEEGEFEEDEDDEGDDEDPGDDEDDGGDEEP